MGSKKKKIVLIVAAIFLAASLFLTLAPRLDPALPTFATVFDLFGLKEQDTRDRITFVDVGQGDGALICSDGHAAMLDCGTGADDAAGMLAALRRAGVDSLDALILSHPHADHIGGAAAILSQVTVGEIRLSATEPEQEVDRMALESLQNAALEYDVPIVPLKADDRFSVGNFDFHVLYCDTDASEENDRSAVIRVSHGEHAVLFTGDATRETEYALIGAGVDLSCDVLKVAHHGSATSTSEKFLYLADPTAAVISVGENTYGHPTDAVLERLAAQDTTIYRTDIYGDITMYFEKELSVSTEYFS